MINDILNGDSASDIREKLNELINIVNDYSSSQYYDAGDGGAGDYTPPAGDGGDTDSGDGGGAGTDSITVWNNDSMVFSGESTELAACNNINMNSTHMGYLQKDAMNMGGTMVPEVNDYLYTNEVQTMPASSGWYGYEDTANMQNKALEVDMYGQITTINNC